MEQTNNNIVELKEVEGGKLKAKVNVKALLINVAVLGGVYALGCSKGMKMGRGKGHLEGYAQATREIANMVKQAVKVTD